MKRWIAFLLISFIAVGSVFSQGPDAQMWEKMDSYSQSQVCFFFVAGYVLKIEMYSSQKLNGRPLTSYASSALWDEASVRLFDEEFVDTATWVRDVKILVSDYFRSEPDAPLQAALWSSLNRIVLKYAFSKQP